MALLCAVWGVSGWFPGEGTPQSAWHAPEDLSRASERIRCGPTWPFGSQYTSWTFTHRARRSGLLPSMGSVGDCYDNVVVEAFWARMQVELLNRQRWRTRIELDPGA